ncbi:MAG TPA: ABC transporter substrate-binding protein [Terriglobales bacterium]|nr:ABC transporter substrate-binding protein [Terriglobales bacterium]
MMWVRHFAVALMGLLSLSLCSCASKPDADTLVVIIESSPNNLDPRVGIDAQSERIGGVIFDALVHRDDHFNLHPWLAESWEIPDPLTYVFHIRRGVKFHDGRPLTARDVKWTLETVYTGKIRTAKTSTFRFIDRIDTPDDYTVVVHLKEPFATLLWNLSDGAIGIVPEGADDKFGTKPVGTGPFRFVSAEQDKDVVIERNEDYWAHKAKLKRVRFAVVPDTTTRALELRKGSADIAINALNPDMIVAMRTDPTIKLMQGPGTIYSYVAMNLRDPILKDVRVRQALAYAMDRGPLIHYLWRDLARPAKSVLPPQHWAYNGNVPDYPHDAAKARALLDAAGFPLKNGVRFHLTMKTSTEESTRLLAAVLQQQLREVGIVLDIRTFEFATFFADVQKGAFQLYSLRWIGGNQDPDIFEYVFESSSIPPKRANRGYYSNPRIDELLAQARKEIDQEKRKTIFFEVQQILANDLPYINLWYMDNVIAYRPRVKNLKLNPSGNFDFLKEAELAP